MDLLGDIVEKDTSAQDASEVDGARVVDAPKTGFPELYKPEKISSWKQRLRAKKLQKTPRNNVPAKKPLSEAESIHQENLNSLKSMTDEQIIRERQELLESLDPKLIKNLLKNINRRIKEENGSPMFAEIEGAPGTWVGGTNDLNSLPQLDDGQVNKALDVVEDTASLEQEQASDMDDEISEADENDVAPLDYQMAQSIDHMANEELLKDVHFVRYAGKKNNTSNGDEEEDVLKQIEKLDIDDADFNDKLHTKYFPDLPKEIDKLKWMEPVSSESKVAIDNVSQIRFDFKGNMVPPSREVSSTTISGLHHHAADPQLAGYTIQELARLSRSTFPQQRTISIQTLGRILYKMGKQSYYQLIPEVNEETYKELGSTQKIMDEMYGMLWDLVKDGMVIESIQDAADEKLTSHLSVRNCAIEALWLWKNGGGDFREKKPSMAQNR